MFHLQVFTVVFTHTLKSNITGLLIVFKIKPGVMHFDTIFRCTHKLLRFASCYSFHWITNLILFLTKKIIIWGYCINHMNYPILLCCFFKSPHSHLLPSFKKRTARIFYKLVFCSIYGWASLINEMIQSLRIFWFCILFLMWDAFLID